MRCLVFAIVVCSAGTAVAGNDGWVAFGFSLGPPPTPSGQLATRNERAVCGDGVCPLAVRARVGGGIGRWGVELHVAAGPLVNTDANFVGRGHTLMWGPMVRYTVFQRWGFGLSVRGGIDHGAVEGDDTVLGGSGCDGPCQGTTIEGPDAPLWAASIGATLHARARIDNGFFGVQVDFDYTAMRVAYPDRSVSGVLSSHTFGIVGGRMF